MKKIIATLTVAIVFSLAVTASQSLHKYLEDTISWKQDKAKRVEIKVYDQKDEFDYSLSTTSRIYLDQSESILLINLEYGVYGFALDSFINEGAFTVCRSRDGQTICIADWGKFWYEIETVKVFGGYSH